MSIKKLPILLYIYISPSWGPHNSVTVFTQELLTLKFEEIKNPKAWTDDIRMVGQTIIFWTFIQTRIFCVGYILNNIIFSSIVM